MQPRPVIQQRLAFVNLDGYPLRRFVCGREAPPRNFPVTRENIGKASVVCRLSTRGIEMATVECELCGKSIPASNALMHSLGCKRQRQDTVLPPDFHHNMETAALGEVSSEILSESDDYVMVQSESDKTHMSVQSTSKDDFTGSGRCGTSDSKSDSQQTVPTSNSAVVIDLCDPMEESHVFDLTSDSVPSQSEVDLSIDEYHQAPPQPTSSSSSSAAAAAAVAPQWECKNCTLRNQHADDICAACENSRFPLDSNRQQSHTWPCSSCTYENSSMDLQCPICGQLRFDSSTARQQVSIRPDESNSVWGSPLLTSHQRRQLGRAGGEALTRTATVAGGLIWGAASLASNAMNSSSRRSSSRHTNNSSSETGFLESLPNVLFGPNAENPQPRSGGVPQHLMDQLPTRVINDLNEKHECLICFDKFSFGQKVRSLPCMHQFHCKCVDRWLKIHVQCPVCKHDVVK